MENLALETSLHLSCTVLSFLATSMRQNLHHPYLAKQVFSWLSKFSQMLGCKVLLVNLNCDIWGGNWVLTQKIAVNKHFSTCKLCQLFFGSRKSVTYLHLKFDALVHEIVYQNVTFPLRVVTSEFTTSVPNIYYRAHTQTNTLCVWQMKS